MRAAAMTPEGHVEVEERAEPTPGPGEVVVEVERCGICGSDLHLRSSGLLPVGAVLGHEFAGRVVGGDPTRREPAHGARVAVLPARRCGACPACLDGRDNLCPAQITTAIGLGLHDGGYAERVVVPVASCHALPDEVTPERGALVEPYAVGLHAVGRSRVTADRDLAVAVIGAGSVGLMCVAALQREGIARVVVAEPRRGRAGVAASMGASVVDRAEAISGVLGRPPEVVFEAAGSAATPARAVEVTAAGGQVVLLGVLGPGQPMEMPGLLWVVKEVDVVPSIAYTAREFAAAVAAVADGAVDAVVAASEVRPLCDAERSFGDLARPDGPVKVLLVPGG